MDVISEEEREKSAIREAGRALVIALTAGLEAVPSVTIILPREEESQVTLDHHMAEWVSEWLAFGTAISPIAVKNLESANEMARVMVDTGFGSQIGLLSKQHHYSERTRQQYDQDIKTLLEDSRNRVKMLLNRNRKTWRVLAGELKEREALSKGEVKVILKDLKGFKGNKLMQLICEHLTC